MYLVRRRVSPENLMRSCSSDQGGRNSFNCEITERSFLQDQMIEEINSNSFDHESSPIQQQVIAHDKVRYD